MWGIVAAGGVGRRFGGPKQSVRVGGRSIVEWSLAALVPACDGLVVVVPRPASGVWVPEKELESADAVVQGGTTRSESVRNGLAAVPDDAAVIVVHDAARPFVREGLVARVIEAVWQGAAGAVPGLRVVDTIKEVESGVVVKTPDRARLVAVQTPQAFRAGVLRRAHEEAPRGVAVTDDAALVEMLGERVVVVAGDPGNEKITTPDDLVALGWSVAAADGLTWERRST